MWRSGIHLLSLAGLANASGPPGAGLAGSVYGGQVREYGLCSYWAEIVTGGWLDTEILGLRPQAKQFMKGASA
jgi:hypothetical protein